MREARPASEFKWKPPDTGGATTTVPASLAEDVAFAEGVLRGVSVPEGDGNMRISAALHVAAAKLQCVRETMVRGAAGE